MNVPKVSQVFDAIIFRVRKSGLISFPKKSAHFGGGYKEILLPFLSKKLITKIFVINFLLSIEILHCTVLPQLNFHPACPYQNNFDKCFKPKDDEISIIVLK